MVVMTIGDAKDTWAMDKRQGLSDGQRFARLLVDRAHLENIPMEFKNLSEENDSYDWRFKPQTIEEVKERYLAEGDKCVDPLFKQCFGIYCDQADDAEFYEEDYFRDHPEKKSFGEMSVPVTDFTNVVYLAKQMAIRDLENLDNILSEKLNGLIFFTDKYTNLPDFVNSLSSSKEGGLLSKIYKNCSNKLGIFDYSSIDLLSRLSVYIPNLRRAGVYPMISRGNCSVYGSDMNLVAEVIGTSNLFGTENIVKGVLGLGDKFGKFDFEDLQRKLDSILNSRVV